MCFKKIMANHLYTTIKTISSPKAIEIIRKTLKSEQQAVCFSSLIPTPTEKYDILEWNKANWGTKWNCYESSISLLNGICKIEFITANATAYPFILAFAKKFKLDFTLDVTQECEAPYPTEFWSNGRRFK